MGSGASTSPPDTPDPGKDASRPNGQARRTTGGSKANEADDQKVNLVRTNEVAPIIIKNCKEEFQHVSEFKEPIVYGRIAEQMPEHALIKNQYFLVNDVQPDDDKLQTWERHLAPNLRRCHGNIPVYGMGQPTRDGIHNFMQGLKEEGFEDMVLVNMREEPVLFIKSGYDMLPYSPRHQDRLLECISKKDQPVGLETPQFECEIRKEVIDLAAFKDDQTFYFYDDIEEFRNDPHTFPVAYEDDLAVSEEIYSRLTFNNYGIRYLRLSVAGDGAPLESDFDAFLDLFRKLPSFFEKKSSKVPALVFTSQTGRSRATLGMVLGCLMLGHRKGFGPDAQQTPYPINGKSPNFERGEYHAVRRLVQYLHSGPKVKQEVDLAIDQCSELLNLRLDILEAKKNLESITEDYVIEKQSAKEYFRSKCIKNLERYIYLICFNAYLHDQFGKMFGERFSAWMQRHAAILSILSLLDVSERQTTPDLITKGVRALVADDYLGLDVLSSQMEVKASNFRRVPGLPVYGMAQPSREGLAGVTSFLLNEKQGHPLVVIFNLRDDAVIECNGATYSLRESDRLEEPLVMAGITKQEIEEKEEQIKKEVKLKKTFKVYQEVDREPQEREFNSVLTCVDLYEQQKLQSDQLIYHRIPMSDDIAPPPPLFDAILDVMRGRPEVHTDEDGPAFVFCCRTGKGRTTTAMAIAGLVFCHNKGFPFGTKPGEEERVSLPNAKYTQGHYKVVQDVVRRIPNGQQVKREVDFILNQCSETMTPMHYHMREVIFVTYNKSKKAKTAAERLFYKCRSLNYLERYITLILFNTYLHCERQSGWRRRFASWMDEVASKVGMYEILDNLAFVDFEPTPCSLTTRRSRLGGFTAGTVPFRGQFV